MGTFTPDKENKCIKSEKDEMMKRVENSSKNNYHSSKKNIS
ncbi:hypothetical protein RC62_278 [Flavobacterium aquidurense]|uniref:Uncharacterized protein n=1 Tax=Flavobacterium aquidurense TaxID=362413 RepID=A0A0N8VMV6_9FLAO|nr:hypothetical protein RC62_278 [Flavobacterium aquidurense]